MSASAEADPKAVNILTKKSLSSNVWTLRYRIFLRDLFARSFSNLTQPREFFKTHLMNPSPKVFKEQSSFLFFMKVKNNPLNT